MIRRPHRVNLRFSTEELQQLQEVADGFHTPISTFSRQILLTALPGLRTIQENAQDVHRLKGFARQFLEAASKEIDELE